MQNINPWTDAKNRLEKTAKKLNLDPLLIASLLEPDKIIQVSLPMKLDNGKVEKFKGYRIQHNNLRGPYKGGLRYHKMVSMDEMKAMSLWMSIKNAVIDIPLGGGKGGIIVDPKKLSEKELERLTRLFTRKIADDIGPFKDIPAPDVNTNSKIISWLVDEYSKVVGDYTPAVATGKPIDMNGAEGRNVATGLGGTYALLAILKKIGKDPKDLTVAVQGFGNVGLHTSSFLQKEGFKIVALSDSKSGLYIKNGIPDIEQVEKCKREKGFLAGCYCIGSVCDLNNKDLLGGVDVNPETILELPVDIIVPAALENVITKNNAHKIKASIVLEMANGPTTIEADDILTKKNVLIIPDVLANSGGVAVSYFEWYQNIHNETWDRDNTYNQLKEKMDKAANEIFDLREKEKITLREAAYTIALKRISESWERHEK